MVKRKTLALFPKSPSGRGFDKFLELGIRIKLLRKTKNWSIRQLARKARIRASTLTRIEEGDACMNFNDLAAVCNVLKVNPAELWPNRS